jgi:GNAT superfamily N-acetyltransferase
VIDATEDFVVSTDTERLDVDVIHQFLREQSTWADGIPRDVVTRAIRNSICFGGYLGGRQVAFARVITDRATFANLVDVFVLPGDRGRGYAARLMQAVLGHPDLAGLRRFTLATSNAHGLYARFGFSPLANPDLHMERHDPHVYDERTSADA